MTHPIPCDPPEHDPQKPCMTHPPLHDPPNPYMNHPTSPIGPPHTVNHPKHCGTQPLDGSAPGKPQDESQWMTQVDFTHPN